jgi:hypothetical protein
MAILATQRNSITPVPPLRMPSGGANATTGNTEELLEKWLPQLLSRTYVSKVDTEVRPAVGSGVLTDVLILPPSNGLWLCLVGLGRVGDAVNFQAAAVVLSDTNSARLIVSWPAPLQTITLAGRTLQSIQTSGSPQLMIGSAVQLLFF